MREQDILKSEEKAVFALRSLYKEYGYLPFKMSKFEEYDLYVRNKDFLVSDAVITFNDTNGTLLALLDRMFYSGASAFAHKPAAAIVSARRAGTTASLEVLTKYFTISQMPVVSSTYWPMVHGSTAADVEQDREGLQVMRNLGKNMAWLLKCIQSGWAHGIPAPMPDKGERTNFIR